MLISHTSAVSTKQKIFKTLFLSIYYSEDDIRKEKIDPSHWNFLKIHSISKKDVLA